MTCKPNNSRAFIYHRWQELDAIHQLKEELSLTDSQYRGLLENQTGTRSAKTLTTTQRQQFLQFLRDLKC